MKIRTKQKGTEIVSDLHTITDKWQEIPDEEAHRYLSNPNIEVEQPKKAEPEST